MPIWNGTLVPPASRRRSALARLRPRNLRPWKTPNAGSWNWSCKASSARMFALTLEGAAKFETSREAYEFLTGFVLHTGMSARYARVMEV